MTSIKSTIDDKILPCVCVYELEQVKKKDGESADDLVNRIRQLAHCALIGDGSNAAIEFEVQRRLISAVLESNIELRKQLLKVDWTKGGQELLQVSGTY